MKFLNLDGLNYFFQHLCSVFIRSSEATEITNEEINEICGQVIYNANEVEL